MGTPPTSTSGSLTLGARGTAEGDVGDGDGALSEHELCASNAIPNPTRTGAIAPNVLRRILTGFVLSKILASWLEQTQPTHLLELDPNSSFGKRSRMGLCTRSWCWKTHFSRLVEFVQELLVLRQGFGGGKRRDGFFPVFSRSRSWNGRCYGAG
jgi:hypothetical protein